ncbi:hypothetical protein GGI25_005841 [Coemansia spiralis]|uniref:Uncharacterized protein n=2 Tax=Coemansia TaxID=4863 RepID=A0A9W8G3X9_9FUNG|nr:hypothetical protein BX070DRAFT_224932 [Coemansia spiralis]KAJ1987325.1 hypothetical protein EDC05_005898 [Coemansia umbellata]KAJ2619221.1 hypothetical protein GGI26_006009 [Coemansia sp. RSA 1358]KAJ2670457.1 hypothetical protein GGI25_005841 [Coemansia spiralis]
MIASKIASAVAFVAVASAQAANPAAPNGRNAVAGSDHGKAIITVTAPAVAAQPVAAAPVAAVAAAPQTVVQNAGTDQSTVTVTQSNGAASLGMSAAALVGTFFAASYF